MRKISDIFFSFPSWCIVAEQTKENDLLNAVLAACNEFIKAVSLMKFLMIDQQH